MRLDEMRWGNWAGGFINRNHAVRVERGLACGCPRQQACVPGRLVSPKRACRAILSGDWIRGNNERMYLAVSMTLRHRALGVQTPGCVQ